MRLLVHMRAFNPAQASGCNGKFKMTSLNHYNFFVPECTQTKFGTRLEGVTYDTYTKRDLHRVPSPRIKILHAA